MHDIKNLSGCVIDKNGEQVENILDMVESSMLSIDLTKWFNAT